MITVRRSADRAHSDHGWLKSHHSFSFGIDWDPARLGTRALQVINEDRVEPGAGFPTHAHSDMEIVTYVLEGALQHKDSTGTGSIIRPGDVQRMSAGSGIAHSEFNASKKDFVRFLQIWLLPSEEGLPPSYEQVTFPKDEMRGRLRVVASPDGRDGSVTIHTGAIIYAGHFNKGQHAELPMETGRGAWVHVARGEARINDLELAPGDGADISNEASVRIEGMLDSEILVMDLA